jgi:hypothetical protein
MEWNGVFEFCGEVVGDQIRWRRAPSPSRDALGRAWLGIVCERRLAGFVVEGLRQNPMVGNWVVNPFDVVK